MPKQDSYKLSNVTADLESLLSEISIDVETDPLFAELISDQTFMTASDNSGVTVKEFYEQMLQLELPSEVYCPISGEVMTNPVRFASSVDQFGQPLPGTESHVFQRSALDEWFAERTVAGLSFTNPLTNVEVSTGFEFVTARDIIQKIKAIILNLIKSVRVLHESDEPAEHASSDNLPAPESKTQKIKAIILNYIKQLYGLFGTSHEPVKDASSDNSPATIERKQVEAQLDVCLVGAMSEGTSIAGTVDIVQSDLDSDSDLSSTAETPSVRRVWRVGPRSTTHTVEMDATSTADSDLFSTTSSIPSPAQ